MSTLGLVPEFSIAVGANDVRLVKDNLMSRLIVAGGGGGICSTPDGGLPPGGGRDDEEDGLYTIECWGGQGGGLSIQEDLTSKYVGGCGGYAKATFPLKKGMILYVYVGLS